MGPHSVTSVWNPRARRCRRIIQADLKPIGLVEQCCECAQEGGVCSYTSAKDRQFSVHNLLQKVVIVL